MYAWIVSLGLGFYLRIMSPCRLGLYFSEGRGFNSHLGQGNFSACPVWME